MAKTEVILTANVIGLGAESDQVKVAAGYARNYLFPRSLANPVSAGNKRRLEVLRQRRAEREAHEFNSMTELAKGMSKLTLLLKVKTGDDGKMFGAITAGTIADELAHQFDIHLDRKKIHLEHPIRTLGDHELELRLHQDIVAKLKIHVESTTPKPITPEPEYRGRPGREGERPTGPRTEKRGRPQPARAAEAAEKPARPAKGEKAEKPAGERPARTARPPRKEKTG